MDDNQAIEATSEVAESAGSQSAGSLSGQPDSCPVICLGVQGLLHIFLSVHGEIVHIPVSQLKRENILALFGNEDDWLKRVSPSSHTSGWSVEKVAQRLRSMCAEAGPFDPFSALRGTGLWRRRSRGSELILHAGNRLMIKGSWRSLGCIEGAVFAYAQPVFAPAAGALSEATGQDLLELLSRWRWGKPALDPHLIMGWLVTGFLAGALTHRPSVYVTGEPGSGKTTLQRFLHAILGPWAITAADSTEAGIRQQLQNSARAVLVDEFEAGDPSGRADTVVKLARIAFDAGGVVRRGSQDGKATAWPINATFLFTAVLRVPMPAQDSQRMAWLDLKRPDSQVTSTAPILPDTSSVEELGPPLLARIIDQWPRFRDTLAVYRSALRAQGARERDCDTYGTLLAAQDLLLRDRCPTSDEVADLAENLEIASLKEARDELSDPDRCLHHLLTTEAPGRLQSDRITVATLIGKAIKDRNAAAQLQEIGLRLESTDGLDCLAVSNTHARLAALFAGTPWQAGDRTSGAWVQSLRQLPGSRSGKKPLRFARSQTRATLIPLSVVLGEDELASNSMGL